MLSEIREFLARLRQLAGESRARHADSVLVATKDIATYRTLVTFLYASPGSLILGLLSTIAPPALVWLASGDLVFLVIFAFAFVIGALRLCTLIAYLRRDHVTDGWAETRRWDREFMLGATILSALIGLNGYLALALASSVAAHLIVIAFNIALASGYVARNAARPNFVMLQLALITFPLAAGLLLAPDVYYRALGGFALLYILNNAAIVFSVHRNLIDLIRANRAAEWATGQLHRKNVTLHAALNTMPHGAALFDEKLNLSVANDRHYHLLSLSPEATGSFAAATTDLIRSTFISRASAKALQRACDLSLAERSAKKVEMITGAGTHLIVHFNPSSDDGILMFTEDATARKNAEAEVERLARFDTLTGLPNRHEFGRCLASAFAELENDAREFALLYLDLDGFKKINDTLGHGIGDALLVQVAERLERRKIAHGMVCRLGGDEFAAICPTAPDKATALAREMIAELSEPFFMGSLTIRIGASIGVAFAPKHGENAQELLQNADIALYRAKANGRGVAMVYDEAMAEEFRERLSLEADLTAALANGALELHYQPIVDLASGRIVSYEALARWLHPRRGYVSPNIFVPIAEQTRYIDQLGEFAIREACKTAANWDDDISVAVNVSVLQFRNPRFLIDSVKSALATHRLPAHRLTLEITESLFIEEVEGTLQTIEEIRALGVRFSLDDFGSGYSSLSLLGRLPLSIVKVDRSLIYDVVGNANALAIVEAVCALAKRIGLTVVVEGIETREQEIAMRLTGVDRVQGWLFGKPKPASQLAMNVPKSSAA